MLIRSGEAPAIGWSRNMLYSGFNILPRSVIRRQTGFAARITRTLSDLSSSMHSKLRYSIGGLFWLTLLVATLVLFLSASSFQFRADLTYYSDEYLPSLVGQQISFITSVDGELVKYSKCAVITDIKRDQTALHEITVRLPLWQKWRIMNSEHSQLAWFDPVVCVGGGVQW